MPPLLSPQPPPERAPPTAPPRLPPPPPRARNASTQRPSSSPQPSAGDPSIAPLRREPSRGRNARPDRRWQGSDSPTPHSVVCSFHFLVHVDVIHVFSVEEHAFRQSPILLKAKFFVHLPRS